ncbi:MAG: quinol:cytochrome C oxidoreductase [Bacteroidota bacterium]|nr:quinol:cytochrome C oxidoreductase [Bacteroidota bacterium]
MKENFIFSSNIKKNLFYLFIVGLLLSVIGAFFVINGGNGHAEELHSIANESHSSFQWYHRLFSNLWINNMYFIGISVTAVFFVAIQYVAQAGWSAGIIRVPMSFGSWLPYGFVLLIITFAIGNHDIFHWTHDYLYDTSDPRYDKIIDGKKAYLNLPFFLSRMVLFFLVWYYLYRRIVKLSVLEDINGGDKYWNKMFTLSAIFVVFYGLSSSVAAWDWILSIDTHWFSTMFGWYVFASWWVSSLAFITYVVVLLKDNGYLKHVNFSVIHDLGKFVFAFSVFWTYIWFSQYMLVYYANLPEETTYFIDRLRSDNYVGFFYANLFMNFFFPFLFLMTRASKRHTRFLKIVCPIILFGHFIDFYLMITPGIVKENNGFGLLEIGILMVYLSMFLFVILKSLGSRNLLARNHPMLDESIHHDI